MKHTVRGAFWFGFYLFLVLFPLVVGAIARPLGGARSFGLEFAVACGYVGLAILSFEFALIARVQSVAGAFGQDALQQFHKQMAYVATVFIVAHPILLFVKGYPWTLLSPFSGAILWMWRWGVISFWTLLLLILVTVFRRHLKIPYEWWQVTHNGMALLVVLCGLVHAQEIGHYSNSKAMEALWAAYMVLMFGIVVRYSIIRPIKLWQVIENITEQNDVRTLVLRPVDHNGFDFEPGQFAWLNATSVVDFRTSGPTVQTVPRHYLTGCPEFQARLP